MRRFASLLTILAAAFAWLERAAIAQCPLEWSSAAPQAQLAGNAQCSTVWDPDGVGPAAPRLVVGGAGLSGGVLAGQRVMTWDGTQWQALGTGPGTAGEVTALTTWGTGVLVASGTFTGGGFNRIAMWNGSAWAPIGTGIAFAPVALVDWNGMLVAGGNVSSSPTISIFNGTWSNLPLPASLTMLRAMVSFEGNLCVGGHAPAGGVLERWTGSAWLPSASANNWITSLAVRAFQFNTWLYVGGHFSTIGGTPANRIASTSGGTTLVFTAVGNGPSQPCIGLHVRATSALGVAVVANLGSGSSPPVAQLTGSAFAAMGNTALSSVSYFGGSYHGTAVGNSAAACMRYDGSAWVPVGVQSITGEVRALTRSGADMIVGGTIQSTSTTALHRIARWNGTTFQPLGTGMQSGTSVDALLTLGNGDVVAGGLFPTAGGVSTNNVARWNGSSWFALGTGCDQQVLALCKLPNGDIVAGGRFTTVGGAPCARVARWNGTTWLPLGAGTNGDVNALAVRSDGVLFAGGAFTVAGSASCNRIAQWNGAGWLPLGTGCNGDVHALAVRPNDDVVAVGAFAAAGGLLVERCARWTTASTWVAMGASSADPTAPRAVCALPNGDVVAGRGFHQGSTSPDSGISRWNGSTWSQLVVGLAANVPGNPVAVRALAQRADGALIVGGDFAIAGGLVANGLAKLSTTCPPLATPYGTGCNAAGPLVLTAETLPWLGATFRTATTGIAPSSLCVDVVGFTPVSIPLASLLGEGQPGCSLLAAPDVLTLLLPDGTGTARTALALAPAPSLLGAQFFEQTIPLEFALSGAIVAVRGSNALALTIGTL